MKMGQPVMEALKGDANAIKKAEQYNGYKLSVPFEYGNLAINWSAVLRDGSHYLRTELKISAVEDTQMTNIIPMEYTLIDGADVVVPSQNGANYGTPQRLRRILIYVLAIWLQKQLSRRQTSFLCRKQKFWCSF